MKLTVFAFGKIKTPGLREAADYYLRLLRPWAALEEIEMKPNPVPDKSPATRRRIQDEEDLALSQRISKIPAPAPFFLLEERGRALSTQEWASWIRGAQNHSRVILAVGSSLGFSDSLRRRAAGTLSLGPQTLSHDLARIVLYEQLYRAWSVIKGHPYHNEG